MLGTLISNVMIEKNISVVLNKSTVILPADECILIKKHHRSIIKQAQTKRKWLTQSSYNILTEILRGSSFMKRGTSK